MLALILGLVPVPTGGQTQSQQSQEQTPKDQEQNQNQSQKKKKGGFFGGLKAVTGESGQQTEATRTAGSKSVGEGEQIGEVEPKNSDRQQVDAMDKYSVSPADLKKFQDQGHLQPPQQ